MTRPDACSGSLPTPKVSGGPMCRRMPHYPRMPGFESACVMAYGGNFSRISVLRSHLGHPKPIGRIGACFYLNDTLEYLFQVCQALPTYKARELVPSLTDEKPSTKCGQSRNRNALYETKRPE